MFLRLSHAVSIFIRIINFALFAYCVLTWVAPRSQIADLLERFTRPFVTPFRKLSAKLIYKYGSRLDFSYVFAMIALEIFYALFARLCIWLQIML